MTIEVFFAVIAAALLHASWNAVIKTGGDRFVSISLMSLGMAAISLAVLPFVAVPQGITWAWIILSAVLHTGYKVFLIKAYSAGDLAQVYPLARGAAPLITGLAAIFLVGEVPTPLMGASIAILCSGIVVISGRGGTRLGQGAIVAALTTSVFIAGYTVTDGIGARTAASSGSYAAWMFLIDGLGMAIFCYLLRGNSVLAIARTNWAQGLMTGGLSIAAYWIVIWAMTLAPIAAVAALRETSILFALAISVFILKERLDLWRLLGAALILTGVIGLRLG